jgi:hypothetical protein
MARITETRGVAARSTLASEVESREEKGYKWEFSFFVIVRLHTLLFRMRLRM